MENNSLNIDKSSGFVFSKQDNWLIPIGMNYNEETNEFETIINRPYIQLFIEYVIKARQDIDPVTNEVISRPLYPYQWVASILPVISVMEEKGDMILQAFSRQSGKSEGIKMWLPFLILFARKYLTIKHKKFVGILGSYKQDTIDKLRLEVLPYLELGIKVFNEMNPSTPLKVVVNNTNKVELKILRGDVEFDYSECYFITLGASQDSLSSHITVIDESGLCKAELFNNSIAPFSASTGGTQVFIGVPSNDPASLIQQKYDTPNIQKVTYNWKQCYTLMRAISPHDAEIYKKMTLQGIESSGGHRAISNRQNYYMEFSATTGRFLSHEIIEEHNMFCVSDNDLNYRYNTSNVFTREYRVGSADISATAKGDYFVISFGVSRYDDIKGAYYTDVKDIITLNKNMERLTAIDKAEIICKLLVENKIDIFIIDSTSQQLHFVQVLRELMLNKGIPTLLIPFRYTKNSKKEIFSRWENDLYSNTCRLPLRDTSWETEKLYDEMVNLIKEVKNGDTVYHAPATEDGTDDHCNAIALLNSALPYVDKAWHDREKFDDGGTREWYPHKSRYVERVIDKQYSTNEKKYNLMFGGRG